MKKQINYKTRLQRRITITALLVMVMLSVTTPGAAENSDPNNTNLQERLQRKISVKFRRTPIEDVVRMIAEQADVDVITSPKLTGEVTVKLTNVALEEALRSILDIHGYDYVVGENIVRVIAKEDMPAIQERLVTEIFEITYSDPEGVAQSLSKFKSPKGTVSYMQGTKYIVVSDTENKIRDMRSFIEKVDQATPQVLVEARIYDIVCKDRFDVGVQWEGGSYTQFDAAGDPVITSRTEPYLTSNFNGTAAQSQNTTAGIRLGWLDTSTAIDFQLKAQQENLNAKLLANPRILVLDNETANIKITSEIPYQELTQTTLGGTFGTTNFKEVGVALEVTPHLAARDEMIRLHLHPVFSVVTSEVQFVSSGIQYPQPVVDTREATTRLIVKNGQTVVLGGLRKKEVIDQQNKVPVLGDLPVLGSLFRFNGEETITSELIVFITPWIVRQSEMTRGEITAHKDTDIQMPPMTYTRAEKETMEKPQSVLQEKSAPPAIEDPNKG